MTPFTLAGTALSPDRESQPSNSVPFPTANHASALSAGTDEVELPVENALNSNVQHSGEGDDASVGDSDQESVISGTEFTQAAEEFWESQSYDSYRYGAPLWAISEASVSHINQGSELSIGEIASLSISNPIATNQGNANQGDNVSLAQVGNHTNLNILGLFLLTTQDEGGNGNGPATAGGHGHSNITVNAQVHGQEHAPPHAQAHSEVHPTAQQTSLGVAEAVRLRNWSRGHSPYSSKMLRLEKEREEAVCQRDARLGENPSFDTAKLELEMLIGGGKGRA